VPAHLTPVSGSTNLALRFRWLGYTNDGRKVGDRRRGVCAEHSMPVDLTLEGQRSSDY